MRNKILLNLYLSVFVTTVGLAQQPIRLLSQDNRQGVTGAYVFVQSLETNSTENLVTDDNGTVEINLALPVALTIQHVNYMTYADTIKGQLPKALFLYPKEEQLQEVVVTGQLHPQSARNSVYQVKTITSDRLQAQGAGNLQDVLQTNLNFRFSRDNAVGSSNLSLMGLSGQYVKVLINGVPMVGRSGTANAIDINQININTIERVEIVEGPMSVEYGADALAGVINIITKENFNQSLSAEVSLQEETVGNNYSIPSEGIHIPAIQVSGQLFPGMGVGLGSRLNHFGGWQGNAEGRQQQWYPKTQWLQNGSLNYSKGSFHINYQLDHLAERIKNLGARVETDNYEPYAIDRHYVTTRFMHRLQANQQLGRVRWKASLAYTDYHRDSERFTNYLVQGLEDEPQNLTITESTFYQSLFFRGTGNWAALTGDTKMHLQLGIENTNEWSGGSMLNAGDKELQELGGYLSAELDINEVLKIKPGIRYTLNSIYETVPTASVHVQYKPFTNSIIRLGYGKGFRTPSLRELYHEFIDANHNILGNPDLEPEYSHTFNAAITQNINADFEASIKGFHTKVFNQITYISPEASNQVTTYTNIDLYKTTGGSMNIQYNHRRLSATVGASYIGRYQALSEDTLNVPEFVFAPEFNSVVQYHFLKPDLRIAAFYKYTGETKGYRLTGDNTIEMQKTQAFNWLDFTITKGFTTYFKAQLGIKNLLDITTVNSTAGTGGAHASNTNGQASVSYGRSYFLKLNFQFNNITK